MSINKKLLTALAILMLAVMLFCSCDTDTPGGTDVTTDPSGDVSGDVTTGDQGGDDNAFMDPENVQIFVEGEGSKAAVNFTVVRPDAVGSESIVVDAAQSVRDSIKKVLDTTEKKAPSPTIKNDFIKSGAEYDPYSYEILVGHTAYPQSAEAAAKCGYGDYVIDIIDNKIVIMAYSDACILRAVNEFRNILDDGYDKETGIITLKKSEIAQKETYNERLSAVPTFDGGTFSAYYDAGVRTVDKKSQCDELIIKSTTPELYTTYLTKLEGAGYTKYTDHTMAGSQFATYKNDKYIVNLGYYDYYKEVRIIIEGSDAPLPGLKSENTYTKVTDSQITMLGLEYKASDGYKSNGLSVLIRLEDGRFIVVDGGFNRTVVADKLISTIKSQSSGYTQKPVIAAWIVTHAHGDHDGMLINHYSKFGSNGIKIESFLLNFMSESERAKSINTIPDNWSSNEGNQGPMVLEVADKLGSTVYKVHVGQVFYFADLEMEIMYTIESFGPKVCNALNTTSTIMKMTFTNNGQKTTYLSTGDATGNGMQISAKMFGDYMHCDIVQTCHHGYSTWGNDAGMIEAYKKVNATLILWPQGLNAHKNYISKGYNNVLFSVPNYREYYVSGAQGDLVIVKLPYNYETSNNIEVSCTGSCPHPHHYEKTSE